MNYSKYQLPAVFSPVLTPVNADFAPDVSKLLAQCQWLDANGVGQAIFGTNSEANSFSSTQKMNALQQLISGGLNPAHMMPGTGACSIDETVQMTKVAVDAGCAGVLMLSPFYYKDVSDDGLYTFYAKVIEKVANPKLKIYVYNIPPVTKISLSVPLLERLVRDFPQTVVGIKDSSGDWNYTESVIKALAGSGFQVYAGSESFLMRTLRAGGVGCISATANVNPKAISDLAANWQGSNADESQTQLDVVRSTFAKYPMIPAMKVAVAHFAKDTSWETVLPPLIPLKEEQKTGLLADLAKLNFQIQGLA
jgi:4-hydroxy-tetrahydrodipicolinate synthase